MRKATAAFLKAQTVWIFATETEGIEHILTVPHESGQHVPLMYIGEDVAKVEAFAQKLANTYAEPIAILKFGERTDYGITQPLPEGDDPFDGE